MATILLIIIYIAFIGLGVPDSLFGTAWPAIYQDFNLPVSFANFVTLTISGGTVISSLFGARLINKFGTAKITAVSTAMTAAALFCFSISNNLLMLCLFSIPLGLGAGAIDSALNNYVALHYKATHMSFLHCFYGVGVSLSPYLMSLALSGTNNWRQGYKTAFFVQLGIAILTIVTLPLWKKVKSEQKTEDDVAPKTVGIFKLAKMTAVRAVWFMFIGSCAVEFTTGTWGSTFLVNTKGIDAAAAAKAVMFYYIGIAVGRFLSGMLAAKLSSWRLIKCGIIVLGAALVLMMLPLPKVFAVVALFMIGLGNGPVFPNLTHLTPISFGRDVSQSVMGSQMAAGYIGIMLVPTIFGIVAQAVGTWIFPYYNAAMFIVLAVAMAALISALKKQNRYEK